jgi:hypothetical protein
VAILKDKPNTLLYLTELSGLLKNARRKGTTTILDRLIEAWDTPETLQNLNKQTPQTAIKPYLSIVAATQPGRIASEMTAEDIASGFANRWLYIVGEGKAPMARPAVRDDFEAGELYLDINDAIRSYPEGFALPWDGDADAVWDDWYYDTVGKMGHNEDEDDMRSRHATLIQKVALIYAVSERSKTLARRHIEPAIALVEWMWVHVYALMREWGVGIDLKIEARIQTVLKKHGPIYRRQLQQHASSRDWSGRDFSSVFRAMVDNGIIAIDPAGLVSWIGGD